MEEKLSAIMIKMAETVLKDTNAVSIEASHIALLLASIAWNREVWGNDFQSTKQYWEIIKELEEYNTLFWEDLKSRDCEVLIDELRYFKRKHYPQDNRIIKSCGSNERRKVQVIWE